MGARSCCGARRRVRRSVSQCAGRAVAREDGYADPSANAPTPTSVVLWRAKTGTPIRQPMRPLPHQATDRAVAREDGYADPSANAPTPTSDS
ncbi:unnamed protein product [Schistocephalus solidus]|uniref:Transposase n=1 Tax=Schistocephalus solidus TaxID=70667 RepID=A0A183T1M9_SCHSO|nr:unnamed protein product [Schistocephalus solidus]